MNQKAIAEKTVESLILKFRQNSASYTNASFNETQARQELINPFFEALGWDVGNKQGLAEQYKDVIHEDAVKVGEQTKAPDYSFRVGGVRKFFVEAKKPSVSIKDDAAPAYQVRRYAWSAKLPLSILTDFQELAIYDCRLKPNHKDKASAGRVAFYTYEQYIEKFDEIYDLFSKEAVLKGGFDKFAQTDAKKKGTTEVDREFLKDIEHWRELLAKNIALRNYKLSNEELNYSVQTIIDRMIFLRICEDRGLENADSLKQATQGANAYKKITHLFESAEAKYNSGFFDFARDSITLKLHIDDEVFVQIIQSLYYPSPYVFSQMPVEILGQVYEQFLGKVIRLTAGHHAKVEEKPEVRKAGGVYYTPQYIVEYIVKNTVGELVTSPSAYAGAAADRRPSPNALGEGARVRSLTPKEIESLKILDPACGSGSFLIGAYTYLLNYHLDWYIANNPEKYPKAAFRDQHGDWRLTTKEAKKILLNNIYGVDIDSQAVEVTKLSLLLKVLENESREGIEQQLKLFKERALPNIDSNIKCGNSLIGPDFYEGQIDFSPSAMLGTGPALSDAVREAERKKINPFDWNREFPEIMTRGGFDAVIGNPPYVRQEELGEYKDYFKSRYQVFHGIADLYTYFIERGVSLLRNNGIFSYIVANKWMRANYGEPLRHWMKQQNIVRIVDFGDLPVFQNATTYPCILTIAKGKAGNSFAATQVKTLEFTDLNEYVEQNKYKVMQAGLDDNGWSLSDEKTQTVIAKIMSKGVPLGEYVNGKIYRGVLTGLNEAFVIDEATRKKLITEDTKSKELIKPFLAGRDIKRYISLQSDKYLIFTRRGIDIDLYPAIKKHLMSYRKQLEPGTGRKPGNYKWHEIQDTVEYYKEFEKPKIIIPAIVKNASYAFDTKGIYSNDKTSIIPTEDLYLLGILNSKVADIVLHSLSSTKQGGYFEYKPMYVQQIPIRKIDIKDSNDKTKHDKIVGLVEQIQTLIQKSAITKTEHERIALQRQIDATDQQIDRLVYELYGLTEEEIKVVEGV